MSENGEDEPEFCPFCQEDVIVIGKTGLGFWVLRCQSCGAETLVKNVIGKLSVSFTVNE